MFKKLLEPRVEIAYAMMRIVCGLMFSFHGLQKIFGVLSTSQPPVFSQVWIGGVIEIVAGFAIALGLFTRCAAFVASGTMAVAYTQFHWRFAFGAKFFPAINQGELAVVYALLFFYIACRGSGPYAIDARRTPSGR